MPERAVGRDFVEKRRDGVASAREQPAKAPAFRCARGRVLLDERTQHDVSTAASPAVAAKPSDQVQLPDPLLRRLGMAGLKQKGPGTEGPAGGERHDDEQSLADDGDLLRSGGHH